MIGKELNCITLEKKIRIVAKNQLIHLKPSFSLDSQADHLGI